MRFPPPPHVIAGSLFVLAAVLAGAIWFALLFVAMPPGQSALESALGQLRYTFSSANEQRWWFAWLAALPVACGLLAVAYLLNASRSKIGGIVLLSISVALAVASFALNDWSLAIFVALPTIWGYRCVHGTSPCAPH
jgi:hypothetical protein